MGAWGTGVFEDDLAMDVKGELEEALEEGMSVSEASRQVLESFEDALDDEEEGPVAYLALAFLQLQYGEVQTEIKKKTLEIIESGQDLERWEEAGKEELARRKQVLQELKARAWLFR